MKKCLIALIALSMILCAGCGKQEPVQTDAPGTVPETTVAVTTEPTVEATVPAPELKMGKALVDQIPAVLSILNREDLVDVVGEYDEEHYAIKTEQGYGLVKKVLLRSVDAEAYEAWKGYARYQGELHDTYYLENEPLKVLHQNAQVEVLEDLGHCYLVRVEDTEGFMAKSDVTRWAVGRGGSGGSSGGNSTGADGGDISLQYQGSVVLLSMIEQTGEVTGQASVLANGTEVVLGYFDIGQEIPVVAEAGLAEDWEGYTTVYLNGLFAHVPQKLVKSEEAPDYEAWDGFSRWNGEIYDNYHLLGDPVQKLYTNASVHVLEELENCYLVEVNGLEGYMSKDLVSNTKIPSGNSGGSNAGGSNAGGGEWTPPAL